MADAFADYAGGLDSPASNAATITPGAGALSQVTRGIYVGGAGNVTVNTVGGQTGVVFVAQAGAVIPVRATHVTAATATDLVALW